MILSHESGGAEGAASGARGPPDDGYVFVPLTLAAANAFVARHHRHN